MTRLYTRAEHHQFTAWMLHPAATLLATVAAILTAAKWVTGA